MEKAELKNYIDQIRDVVFEAWNEGIRSEEEMIEFMDEIKKQVLDDYNDVYDNLGWFGRPSEYRPESEYDDENEDEYEDV
jgi:hypothetical protein